MWQLSVAILLTRGRDAFSSTPDGHLYDQKLSDPSFKTSWVMIFFSRFADCSRVHFGISPAKAPDHEHSSNWSSGIGNTLVLVQMPVCTLTSSTTVVDVLAPCALRAWTSCATSGTLDIPDCRMLKVIE